MSKKQKPLEPKRTKDGKYQCPYDDKVYDDVEGVKTCIEKHFAKLVPG